MRFSTLGVEDTTPDEPFFFFPIFAFAFAFAFFPAETISLETATTDDLFPRK
jgi:hypothetical protein